MSLGLCGGSKFNTICLAQAGYLEPWVFNLYKAYNSQACFGLAKGSSHSPKIYVPDTFLPSLQSPCDGPRAGRMSREGNSGDTRGRTYRLLWVELELQFGPGPRVSADKGETFCS